MFKKKQVPTKDPQLDGWDNNQVIITIDWFNHEAAPLVWEHIEKSLDDLMSNLVEDSRVMDAGITAQGTKKLFDMKKV